MSEEVRAGVVSFVRRCYLQPVALTPMAELLRLDRVSGHRW
jgi:hypothetical protein